MTDYLALNAAPGGRTSGLAVGTGLGVQARVVVLPKAWAPAGRGHGRVLDWSMPPGDVDLTLFETEICVVRGDASQVRVLRSLVEHSETATVGEDDERRPSPMLGFAAVTSGEAAGDLAAGADALLPILELAQRLRIVELAGEAALALTYAPRLRVLLHRAFVAEVEQRLRRVPKRYIEHEESLSAVRGRILGRSIIRHQLTHIPQLDCRFDDLVAETPILAIVTAALERVAVQSSGEEPSPAPSALALRRQLGATSALAPAEALRVARAVRLNRLDRVWARALELSIAILQDRAPAPQVGATAVTSFEVTIQTWRVWEAVLDELLRPLAVQAGVDLLRPGETTAGLQIARPFRPPMPLDSPLVDYTWLAESLVLLDAKYKLAAEPRSSDQYQAFAYTYLHRIGTRRVEHYVLLYAGPSGSSVAPSVERTREWPDDPPVTQRIVHVPFPSPRECQGSGWSGYRDSVAPALRQAAGLP